MTSGGPDTGGLADTRQPYVQDGKIAKNPVSTNVGCTGGDLVTDELCSEQKRVFDDLDISSLRGAVKAGRAEQLPRLK